MADDEFRGEKLTITRVELALIAALGVVVATFLLLGAGALVVLGVVLSALMMVLMVVLASGRTPRLLDDD